MGGSDQWGNITTGTELIRRKSGGEAFALTTQLIKKADGSKFGKSESGNIWLDKTKTSPYKFYQFWLNASDADAATYIKYFTLFDKDEVEALEEKHKAAPHERHLQKALAKDITVRVHGEQEFNDAVTATEILFKGSVEDLAKLDEATFLDVFDGVPMFDISKSELTSGIGVLDFLAEKTKIFPSKGEARKMVQAGGVSVNKQKWEDEKSNLTMGNTLNNKYILVQKGKKNYFLCKVN